MAYLTQRILSEEETRQRGFQNPSVSVEIAGARDQSMEGTVLATIAYRPDKINCGFYEVYARDVLEREHILGATNVQADDKENLARVLLELGEDLIANRRFAGLNRIARRY